MKIKTKLIVSFFIIIFVPILLASIALIGLSNFEEHANSKNYGLQEDSIYAFTHQLELQTRLTQVDYQTLLDTSVKDPGQLLDPDFQQALQDNLTKKCSYLVVVVDGDVVYNPELDNDDVLWHLPGYGEGIVNKNISCYIYNREDVMFRQVDFETPDGIPASAYILTTTRSTGPAFQRRYWQLIIAMVIILTLTAMMLYAWLYNSVVSPLGRLQVAVENIKEGNLDFEMETIGTDEIGDLCVTFEQMRQRLKDNAEEKLANEKENRALVSNIVHDLKTPITAIKGYSEGILDGVANTPEKVERYVRTIYNKANEMNTLINELTLYSNIDTNRIPYNFAKLNVSEYFADCVAEIGMDLEEKGVGLAYYNYVDDDTLIIADPEQLRRVISNIIGNSVKYMDKQNGVINIRIKDVGDFIQVEMEDNGRGISQKDLPYIFDRFYRADASRNSAIGGSGIGLSIVKKIIEDHGGKIWATSKEDTGTCMYFVIRKYQEVK